MNADLRAPSLVAGIAVGADSIDDMDVQRHASMDPLFSRRPDAFTLGSFLRSFTWGNARRLGKVSRVFPADLAAATPLLPGKDALAFIDIGRGCN